MTAREFLKTAEEYLECVAVKLDEIKDHIAREEPLEAMFELGVLTEYIDWKQKLIANRLEELDDEEEAKEKSDS